MDDIQKSNSEGSYLQEKSVGCPNKSNPYHQCRLFCKTQWGEQDIKPLDLNPEAQEFIPSGQQSKQPDGHDTELAKEIYQRQQKEEKLQKKIILRKKNALLKRKILDSWNEEKSKKANDFEGNAERKADINDILPEKDSIDEAISEDNESPYDDTDSEDDSYLDYQEDISNDENSSTQDEFEYMNNFQEENCMTKKDISQVEKDWNEELYVEYGEIRPEVMPTVDKPGNYTNEMRYLKETVLQAVQSFDWESYKKDRSRSRSRYYTSPIKNSMDLTTIKLRLQYNYYSSAKECIKDFNVVFSNLYVFYKEEFDGRYVRYGIIQKVMTLENTFLSKILAMLTPEVMLNLGQGKSKRKKQAVRKIKKCPKKPSFAPLSYRMMAENGPKICSKTSQNTNCWSLENLPEDEMKLILPFLHKKDLKSLRLVSKSCAKQVILYDKRMQKWHIIVDDSEEIYKTVKKSKLTEYFPFVSVKLCSNDEYGSSCKKIIKTLRNHIVELDIFVDEDDYLNEICISNLTKLRVWGYDSLILQNQSIARTVKSIAVTNSEEVEEYDVENVFTEIQSLCLKDCEMNPTWMISQKINSLIILEHRNIDIGSLPVLPNLKILMVDHTSIKLIYKCAESLEYLNMIGESLECLGDMYDDIDDDFTLPKLKHLVFGEGCYPSHSFVTRHKATLETLAIQDMYPFENEMYSSRQIKINENFIKQWMTDCPLLQTFILPYSYWRKDKSRRVKVIYKKKDAVKTLKHICQNDYNVMDDEFIKYTFSDNEDDESSSNLDDSNDDSNSEVEDDGSNSNFEDEDQDSYDAFNLETGDVW